MPTEYIAQIVETQAAPDRMCSGLLTNATPMVGRQREVASIRRQLLAGDVRLLTLTGAGGIGKSRLALEVAAAVDKAFAGRVVFVSLAPVVDPASVAPAIARALCVPESRGLPVVEDIIRAVQNQRVLLVLDNFEHLLPAAPLIAQLLAACTGLKILVTSRAAMHLSGEHEFAVPPLALPPRWLGRAGRPASPEALMTYEAIALFVQRARAVRHDFVLTAANGRTLAEICARLDGLPLAIELAAARTRLLPPEALLARLGRRLALLTGGPRDLPARQQTLRGTVEWSYAILKPAEQVLLARLSVFAGTFGLAGAAAIAAPHPAATDASGAEPTGSDAHEAEVEPGTLEQLAALVDMSLVRQVTATDTGPDVRFTLLETVREYALERLEEQRERESTQRRHAEYFLSLALRAAPALRGPDQAAWLARLDVERENLLEALHWWVEQARAGDPEAAVQCARLAGALWRFWYVRGPLAEGRHWLARVLALAPAPGAPATAGGREATETTASGPRSEAVVETAFGAGVLAMVAGDYDAARATLEMCLRDWRKSGDVPGQAYALLNLGKVEMHLGAYPAARALLEQSTAAFRKAADRPGLAWPLSILGYVRLELGDPEGARTALQESVALFREHGEQMGLAQSLHLLGVVADDQGQYVTASDCLQESLGIRRALSEWGGLALTVQGLAGLAAVGGQSEQAVRLAGAADALRAFGGVGVFPALQARLDRRLAGIKAALGDEAFAAAFVQGQEAPFDEALDQAAIRQSLPQATARVIAPTPTPSPSPSPDLLPFKLLSRAGAAGGSSSSGHFTVPLSPREREVAALVAQGLTNRQIAARLFITPGTAGVHVEHILDKLGLQSRVQVATWAVAHGVASGSF